MDASGRGSGEPAYKFSPIGELVASYEPPIPKIDGFLYEGDLACIFGDSGSCKTFLVVDLICALTLSHDWHGKEVNTCPVFLLVGEGFHGLAKRMAAWSQHNDESLENADILLSHCAANLYDDHGARTVLQSVKYQLEGWAGKQKPLIVVDTLARNFGPGDESKTSDMSKVINNIDVLRKELDATVLIVHHTGLGDRNRARGSYALKAALDVEYKVTKDNDGAIRVECTKAKDHKPPEPLSFQPKVIELPWLDSNGEPETSLVLEPVDWTPPQRKSGLGKSQQQAVRCLEELYSVHRENLENDGRDPKGARVALDEWREVLANEGLLGDEAYQRQRFSQLKGSLTKRGVITIEGTYVYFV